MRRLFMVLVFTSTGLAQTLSGGAKVVTRGVVPPPGLAIVAPACVAGFVGTAYTCTLFATGGALPYAWSVVSGSLPTGLTLSSSGVISGNPSVAGSFTSTIQVADSALTRATTPVTITINLPAGLTISAAGCTSAYVNVPFSCTLTASNGTPPYVWTMLSRELPRFLQRRLRRRLPWWRRLTGIVPTALPPGLTLSSSGVISGTPTTAGDFVSTVQVTDSSTPSALTASAAVTISVSNAPSRIAVLPQTWANPHEADLPSIGVVTKYIHTDGSGDYPCNYTGLNQSMIDWTNAPAGVWWHVIVDDSLSVLTGGRCQIDVGTTNNSRIFLLRAKPAATGFIVYESAHPNSTGQTLCNHISQLGNVLAGLTPENLGCTNDIQNLWKIFSNTTGTSELIGVDSQAYARNIVIRDVELAMTSYNGAILVQLNNCVGSAASLSCGTPGGTPLAAAYPSHIGIERSYFYGDFDANAVSPSGLRIFQALRVACGLCWAEWNYFERITRSSGSEGQVFGCTDSQPGFKLAHNTLIGGEEGFICGGGPTQLGRQPSDMEIRDNIWTVDLNYMLPKDPNGPASYTNCKVSRKNPGEFKIGLRMLVDGNLFERNLNCGQQGQQLMVTATGDPSPPINGKGGQSGEWDASITDLTVSNNVFRHSITGLQGRARSASFVGDGDSVGRPGYRNNYINNLLYDATNRPGGGGMTWRFGQFSQVLSVGAGQWANWYCTGLRDSAGATTTLSCLNGQTNEPPWNTRTQTAVGEPVWVQRCTPSSFNISPVNALQPALSGTNGLDPNGLTVVYANPGTPNQTSSAALITSVQLTSNLATYTYGTLLGPAITVGQTISVSQTTCPTTSGCTSAEAGLFNVTDATVTAVGTNTFSVALTHIDVPATALTEGYVGCSFRNIFGAPFQFVDSHNTWIGEGQFPYPLLGADLVAMRAYGGSRVQGATIQDNLIVNAPDKGDMYPGGNGQLGNADQIQMFDTSTLIFNHIYFSYSGRTASRTILAYPGQQALNDPAGAVWMQAAQGQQICPGATADVTCLGMNGFMNGVSWVSDPPSSSDPLVFYSLVPTSVYKAGGSRQAHDGTDMGANLEQIRTHMNSTIYSGCTASSGTCGAGPNPD